MTDVSPVSTRGAPKASSDDGIDAGKMDQIASRRTSKPTLRNDFSPMTRVVTAQVQSEKLVTDRRDRIIRAAITVFHRQGFHSTTTADIAREAGLTQSNLYNYVKSKQDVLFLVCEHLVGIYEQLLDEVAEQYEDPHTRIVEALRAVTRVMGEYRDYSTRRRMRLKNRTAS